LLKAEKEKTILKQVLIVMGIVSGLYFFGLKPFLKDGGSILDEELERKTIEIKRYISRTGSLPSKQGFDKLEQENLAMEDKLRQLTDFMDPEKIRVAESDSEAGLFFIEKLHSSIKKFSEEAGLKNITLPENLGFGDGLPKEDLVDTLLRQMEIVEMVLDVLLQNESVKFYSIKPLKSIDYIEPITKEIFYSEIPVQISIKTNTEGMADLLLRLKNSSPVISVKEIHVKSSESDRGDVDMSLVLSGFKIAGIRK
jgi:hypothetical protein